MNTGQHRMTVAINGLSLLNRSGTGRVVEGLLEGLSHVEAAGFHFDVILPRDAEIQPGWTGSDHLEFHRIGPAGPVSRVLWEQTVLPRWVRRRGSRILHSPAFVAPVYGLRNVVSVITVHDLAFLRFPRTVKWDRRFYYRWAILASIRHAHLILTDSQSIRSELLSMGLSGERVKVLPLGVQDRFFSVPRETVNRVRKTLDLPDQYLLTVGTVEPRKNLVTLITVLRQAQDIPPLVIAGRLAWGYDSLQREIKEKKVEDRVHFVDYVPDRDLPGLYAGAEVYLAASLYEGFGLTVLEAMAAGCRVIASDIPAHREVGGECIRYVHPTDVQGWIDAVTETLSGSKPGRAVDKAREFSWLHHAHEYLEILLSE